MDPEAPIPDYSQKADQVSAVMAELAKKPPDLIDYFRVQGAVIAREMGALGFAYFVCSKNKINCLLAENLESLKLNESSSRKDVLSRAIEQVVHSSDAVILDPDCLPETGLHGQSVDEVPASHRLPLFNDTRYYQFFVPIPMEGDVSGVFHVWFEADIGMHKDSLLESLKRICGEVKLYFQSIQASQLVSEMSRVHSYTQFLESLSGAHDLSFIARSTVDYVRRAVSADRVSLLLARDYRGTPPPRGALFDKYQFYTSCGVQVPHEESAEASVLEQVAHHLLEDAKRRILARDDTVPEDSMNVNNGGQMKDLPPSSSFDPQRVELSWVIREESEDDDSPVQDLYCSVSPMNWATVLPLYDVDNSVCAVLLVEGKSRRELAASALLSMGPFSLSLGRVLGRFMALGGHFSLRCACRWVSWKNRILDTRKKRRSARWLVPLVFLSCVLFFPTRFNVKAIAQVRPERVVQLPAQSLSRIVSVPVHEGESVQKGDLLIQLDTYELELDLQRYQGEYLRAITESDRFLEAGDEGGMQSARLQAQKALAQAENVRYQIERASLRAPFDCLVLGPKGLTQKMGQVAQVGEPLVEVASPETWEVRVHLSEQNLVLLERQLTDSGAVDGKLKLVSNPSESYPVVLSSPKELSYGLNIIGEDYYFDAVIPLEVSPSLRDLLRAGFEARVAFNMGWRPLVYVLFRDVFLFVKVNWF